ncbi:MAG: anti-sigma factor [Gemmatimonadota bacterium]|nr:anti-sigma factor [Gemmatimonadota bacterium]
MNAPEMVPCDHVIERLWEYIDGALDPERAAKIEAHLEICARCFPEYDFRRAYRSFVQQVGPRSMPSEMKRRVFEALLEEERQTGGAGAPAARMEPASGWRGMLRRLLGRGVDA